MTTTLPQPTPLLLARRAQPGAHPLPRSLSPSRVSTAAQCHRLYGWKYFDREREPKSADSATGALLHVVLEALFDLEPSQRTPEAAEGVVGAAWGRLLAAEPDYADRVDDLGALFAEVSDRLKVYFALEDPTVLADSRSEVPVDITFDGMPLVGAIDRIDFRPGDKAERITDYKAGKPPRPDYADSRLDQVKMYALARWVTTGRIPALVRLMYLGGDPRTSASARIVEWVPTEDGLRTVASRLRWAWEQINTLHRSGDRTPAPQTLCSWCPFLDRCPEGQQMAAERENRRQARLNATTTTATAASVTIT